jgi:hypothetical protein
MKITQVQAKIVSAPFKGRNTMAKEAEGLVESGFPAIELKVG